MVLNILRKAFGKTTDATPKETAKKQASKAPAEPDLVGFVEYAVTELVDDPTKVNVKSTEKDDQIHIEISCDKPDIGKVIGKKGKTIGAIRSLATGVARRTGKHVKLDVLD